MTVDRKRLARLVGKLGSDAEAERLAAVASIAKAIDGDWPWLCDVVERGALPSADDPREELVDSLIRGRLFELCAVGWTATVKERAAVNKIMAALNAGRPVRDVPIDELMAALEIAEAVKRRNQPGPAKVHWR